MRRPSGPAIAVIVLLVAFLMTLYVLSIGPAHWLIYSGYAPAQLGNIYWPIRLATDTFPVLEPYIRWYCIWWIGGAPSEPPPWRL